MFTAEHLEVLRLVPGGRGGVGLVPGVRHAHAFDGALLNAIDRLGRFDAGCFQDSRHDVNDMVELAADAAQVRDVAGPGHGEASGCPAEVRRDLLVHLNGVSIAHAQGAAKWKGPIRSPELSYQRN